MVKGVADLREFAAMILEVFRVVIVLGIVYWLLGVVLFGALYEKWSYSATLFIHLAVAGVLTFIWYRRRGRKRGWF